MAYYPATSFVPQFFTDAGVPLSGGSITAYEAGSTTLTDLFIDIDGTSAGSTINLNARGEPVVSGNTVVIWLDTEVSYKFILKDASAVTKWTIDDIYNPGGNVLSFDQSVSYPAGSIGARLLRQLSAKDAPFNAVGDGVTDDTTAMQAFLTACSGKYGFIPPGTYLCNTLTVYSGTTLVGAGMTNTRIKAVSSLGNTSPLLKNATTSGTINTYYDSDMSFEGITFDGNGVGDALGSRTAELVGISKAQNTTWSHCRFTNVKYIGLAHGGCKNTRILNCKLDAIGNPASLAVAGPAFWFGNHSDGSTNEYVQIIGGKVENCNESGGNLGANHVTVMGLQVHNVKESGLFAAEPFHDHIYIGVDIRGVTKNYISSSGIEWGIDNGQIIGGTIAECDANNIALTNTQGITISDVNLRLPARDAATFTDASHIAIVTTVAAPNQPRDIVITGCRPSSAAPNAYAFLNVGNSGDAVINLRCENNNTAGQTYTNANAKAVFVASGKRGAKFITKNNNDGDNGVFIKQVTLTAATGLQAITGIGFRPSGGIRITTTITSTSDLMQSTGICDNLEVVRSNYIATGGGGTRAGSASNTMVNVVNPAGTNQIIAALSSIDEDGFTLNKTTAAIAGEALIECWP